MKDLIIGKNKKAKKIRAFLAGLVIFYFTFMCLVAPLIIRSQAIKQISKLIQRPVEIEKVSINPFCNSLSIKKFAILAKDKSSFFEWDELYVNIELSSILTFSLNLDEIRLDQPQVTISRLSANIFNFSDILETLNSKPKEESAPLTELPPISVRTINVNNGKVYIKDFAATKAKKLDVTDFDLHVYKFNTRKFNEENNLYDFQLLTEHDAKLHWQGQLTLLPLKSTGSLKITSITLLNE